jgi:hypothetical protein
MNEVVLFHTHGLGPFDFSAMGRDDLHPLDRLAAARSAYLCPTIFLKLGDMRPFGDLLTAFNTLRSTGELPRILGFSMEGPVLGRRGGTPFGSVWRPTMAQWLEIASWFKMGLRYIVVSPDAVELDEEIDRGFKFGDLLSLIYRSGGRVALGHFDSDVPDESADRLFKVLNYIEERYINSPYLILTDHLFNDMPRQFRHAFRTAGERESREAALESVLGVDWSASDLPALLGPVPAALLSAAAAGRLTPSLNFDGGHVDIQICRRVVEFLGSSRVIAMTDHTESGSLGEEPLSPDPTGALLYRSDGVLAASAVPHEQQRRNMIDIGLDESAINQLFFRTPLEALMFTPTPRIPMRGSK